jgi:hypothetical protein
MRKELFYTITDEGRDKGKMFKITEAPAVQADRWGIRAMLALNKNGVAIPDEIMRMGLIGIIAVGIHKLRGVAWEDLEPLLDDMMGCVMFVPTPAQPNIIRKIMGEDIEEVATLAILRKEVLQLHVGFTPPADQSTSQTSADAEGPQSTMPTSRQPSAPSSGRT